MHAGDLWALSLQLRQRLLYLVRVLCYEYKFISHVTTQTQGNTHTHTLTHAQIRIQTCIQTFHTSRIIIIINDNEIYFRERHTDTHTYVYIYIYIFVYIQRIPSWNDKAHPSYFRRVLFMKFYVGKLLQCLRICTCTPCHCSPGFIIWLMRLLLGVKPRS